MYIQALSGIRTNDLGVRALEESTRFTSCHYWTFDPNVSEYCELYQVYLLIPVKGAHLYVMY